MFAKLTAAHGITFALVSTVASAQCQWGTVPTPNPSDVINVITCAEGSSDALHALLIADDSPTVGNPVEPHVLRRDGGAWSDLGGPGLGALDEVPVYLALHADEEGRVWLAGSSQDEPNRPVIASLDGVWSAPYEIDLHNQVLYPFHERSGSIYALDTAPDGTMFAVGTASNHGLTDDGSIPLFLVDDGLGWQERTLTSTDWPGEYDPNTYLTDVIALASDDVWAVGRHAPEGGSSVGGLIVHWDGTALTIVEDPRNGGKFLGHPLQDMVASGPDSFWAVGGSFFMPQTSTIARYDGVSWARVESPVDVPLRSIAVDNGTAWAASANFGSDLARFDGQRWTAVAPPTMDANIVSMARDPQGAVWMFGANSLQESLALRYSCPRTSAEADRVR